MLSFGKMEETALELTKEVVFVVILQTLIHNHCMRELVIYVL